MGKKEDIVMDYLSQPHIIADLFNGYVFQGKQVIKPEMIRETDGRVRLLLADEKGKKQKGVYEVIKRERDIVREIVIGDKKLRLMICGVEHQSNIDYSMPLRVLTYDTLEYLKQAKQIEQEHKQKKDVSGNEFLSMFGKEDYLIPTITIIFYTGREQWDGARDLNELFNENEYTDIVLPYMVTAPLNLISIYDMKDTSKYHSSLKQIFELMSFTDDKNALSEYLDKNKDIYSKVDDATARLLSMLLDLEILNEQSEDGEESGFNVCKAVEDMRKDSREEGIAKGKREIVLNMLTKNLSPEEISDLTGISLERVKQIANNL